MKDLHFYLFISLTVPVSFLKLQTQFSKFVKMSKLCRKYFLYSFFILKSIIDKGLIGFVEPFYLQGSTEGHNHYRFSAFWLRSKCSICSYQLNIWYESQRFSMMLNWFLNGDDVLVLAQTPSFVGLTLQYRKDWQTTPLKLWNILIWLIQVVC